MQRALSLRSHIICHGEVPAATVTTDLAHDVLEAEFLVRVLSRILLLDALLCIYLSLLWASLVAQM